VRDRSPAPRPAGGPDRRRRRYTCLAGMPSYLMRADLAVNLVLPSSLPRPEYPPSCLPSPGVVGQTEAELLYARDDHARHGLVAQTAGALVRSACQTAHALLAARGESIGAGSTPTAAGV